MGIGIVLYRGSRGRGKTLSMVRDAYIDYMKGYRILSNMRLKFGEYVTSEEVLSLNRDSQLYNCILVLDEVQLFFDSRNFSKTQNKDFSNFIQQIRKRNVNIYCTTQYINTVDLRLRQHIDVIAMPKFYKGVNIVRISYYDLTKLEDGLSDIKPVTVVYNSAPFFCLYDTNEMLR